MGWTWSARYEDGTVLTEREVGTFTAVDRDRCVELELRPAGLLAPGSPIVVRPDLGKGERAAYFRRNRIPLTIGWGLNVGQGRRETVWCIGVEGPDDAGVYAFADKAGRVQLGRGRE